MRNVGGHTTHSRNITGRIGTVRVFMSKKDEGPGQKCVHGGANKTKVLS